jgi:hypothetical protein
MEGFRAVDVPGQPGFRAREDGKILTNWTYRGRAIRKHNWIQGDEWFTADTNEMDSGYVTVRMYDRRDLVHRVILLSFIGPCPTGLQCRHGNGKRNDNRLDNLSWGTQSENEIDKRLHGTAQIGERNGMARLQDADVILIRQLYESGHRVGELARMFDETHPTISRIIARKTYKHV